MLVVVHIKHNDDDEMGWDRLVVFFLVFVVVVVVDPPT